MLKFINAISLTLALSCASVNALQQNNYLSKKDNFVISNKILNLINNSNIKQHGGTKKEQGSYNVNSSDISRNSMTPGSLYTPALFPTASIFSGNNRDDDDDDDKKDKLYKANGYYYNVIPDNTKDIDVILLLANGLIAFLSSANITFNEAHNEFIERLYLIILFIKDSVAEKDSRKIMMHICNRVRYEFQISLYSEDNLFSKNLDIQQKRTIINSLPTNLTSATNNEEYYGYMEALKNFSQKLIIGFIWVTDLDNISGGEIILDTNKILENAKDSEITNIQNLKEEIYSNRAFFKKNKNMQVGCLRKDSKKYKKKFLASNIVHQVHLEENQTPSNYLADIFRKTINKRLIEQRTVLKDLPDSAIDIIHIIAKGFNYKKILLFLEKIKNNDLNKFLIEFASNDTKTHKTENLDKTVIFLKLDIAQVLKYTILEQIKLRLSRQELAEIIINILGEKSNEVIYQIQEFLFKKLNKENDNVSLKSTSSDSISSKGENSLIFDPLDLSRTLEQFLYSISCNYLSRDMILFFVSIIDKLHLYTLADENNIKYEKYNSTENGKVNAQATLLLKILKSNKDIKNTSHMLFKLLSEQEKIKIHNYFKNISKKT